MAGPTSGDRPVDFTSGAIEGQQQSEASAPEALEGVYPPAREFSRDVRQRAARQREQSVSQHEQMARARLDAADGRDAVASVRDLAALARDQAAAARDFAMAQREQELGALTSAELALHVAEYRALAAQDRQRAAQDREEAARERLRALVDRESLLRHGAMTETDPLTGARARAAGLADLDHELERCRRTNGQLVVAYVDVVDVQSLSDREGHDAGDELIQRVVTVIKAHLRPYDLIVRLGADEFLCAMSSMTLTDARQRFSVIATAPYECPIRTGFVEFAPDETAAELIARADSQLD